MFVASFCALQQDRKLTLSQQIDLESSDDDIQDIQAEIAVLSTCASPYVTQYKGCFLRGHKLWIVMEYLGGGSCLDLVSHIHFSTTYNFANISTS